MQISIYEHKKETEIFSLQCALETQQNKNERCAIKTYEMKMQYSSNLRK